MGMYLNKYLPSHNPDLNSIPHWSELTELENIVPNYNNIFLNQDSIMVINEYNKIICIGNNESNKLGINNSNKVNKTNSGSNCYRYSKNSVYFKQIDLNNFDKNEKPILISNGILNYHHTFIYTSNDNLYANGQNNSAEFGNGTAAYSSFDQFDSTFILSAIPTFWNINERLTKIYCGSLHTLFLTSNNNLYACGYNKDKRISIKFDCEYILTPKLIYNNIIDAVCSKWLNILINASNDLIVFGSQSYCNGGMFNTVNCDKIMSYFKNQKIKIKSIDCGEKHGLVLSVDNVCYSFGANDCSQCGNGRQEEDGSDALIIHQLSLICKDKNNNRRFRRRIDKPVPIVQNTNNNENIIQISCGVSHNVMLSNLNNVYVFGDNGGPKCSILNGNSFIRSPYCLDKEKELGIDVTAYIDHVFALTEETIIIINPNKTAKV